MVDTRKTQRRDLHFHSLDDLLHDAERLAEEEKHGRVYCAGNWTLGQIFGHLATWIEFAYSGTPLKTPWFVKLFMKLRGKKKFLEQPMPAAVKIPGVSGGTLGHEELSTAEGLAKLRAAVTRLKNETPTAPNALFGPLTHEEWTKLHLRHGELHLSFAHVR